MVVPTRTFSANVGQTSTGTRGPDQLETDLDAIFTLLNAGLDTEHMANGAASDDIIGSRTVDQAIATASADTGTLTQLLSWIVKAIFTIQGDVTNWYDTPDYSLTDLKDEIDDLVLGEIPEGSIYDSQLALDIKVGSLATLNTAETGNITDALNEVHDQLEAEQELILFSQVRGVRRLV